jgi:hypothetical protein
MFLFRRLVIFPSMCTNPLAWWKTREGWFLNASFLTKQVLGIPWFQIKIERVLSLVIFWQLWSTTTYKFKIWTKLLLSPRIGLMICTWIAHKCELERIFEG